MWREKNGDSLFVESKIRSYFSKEAYRIVIGDTNKKLFDIKEREKKKQFNTIDYIVGRFELNQLKKTLTLHAITRKCMNH